MRLFEIIANGPHAIAVSACAALFTLLICAGCATSRAELGVLHDPQQRDALLPGAAPLALVENGKAAARIVLPDAMLNAGVKPATHGPGAVLLAGQELQAFIEKATGARLPLVASSDFDGGPAVFVGMSEAARQAGFQQPQLEAEAFQVLSAKGALGIFGTGRTVGVTLGPDGSEVEESDIQISGPLFGVYDVLERFVGVRFYWPGDLGTIVPQAHDLTIPAVNYTDWPVMTDRRMWKFHGYPDSPESSSVFEKRWRGGYGTGITCNHSHAGWHHLYAEAHPEYFALRPDGSRATRTPFGSDLCYSHPAVLAQDVENMKRFYETDGQWRGPWGSWVMYPRNSFIPFMPADVRTPCVCEDCQKQIQARQPVIAPNGRDYGVESELIHQYHADIAEEIQKLWPERWVIAGAYASYAFAPQTVEFPGNVIAYLCIMPTGGSFWTTEGAFEFWSDQIDRWIELTGQPIHVWHYRPGAGVAPMHMPRRIVAWHRQVKGRVAGQFYQQSIDPSSTFARTHINRYFWNRAMWNPDFDVDQALEEYYELAYGPAAPVMKAYFELMMERCETGQWGGLRQLYTSIYPRHIRDRLKELEAMALELAGNDTVWRHRVDFVIKPQEPFYRQAVDAERHFEAGGKVLPAARGTPAKIDGRLNDDVWQIAPKGTFGTRGSGAPIDFESRVQVAYDDNALYIAAFFDEPDMDDLVAAAKERGQSAWADDGIEVFLAPRPDIPEHYLQIAINTLGVVFDGWRPIDATFTARKDFAIERAVVKQDDGWSLEVKIPYSEMDIDTPKRGDSWGANFIWNRGKMSRKGLHTFSPTFNQSNHDPDFFGVIHFE